MSKILSIIAVVIFILRALVPILVGIGVHFTTNYN